MELTVEVLRDAEFREGWRGYNPADVDEFIDRVSVGVQELHDRIHALTVRADRAESRLGGENDETVKRTLVLAQRAADLVVSEAKSVAERIVQDAHREADRTVADANAAAVLKREQSEQEIARVSGELRRAAEIEHERLMSHFQARIEEAEQTSRLSSARANEMYVQATTLRDRFRAALTDQLVRLDRLVEAVDPGQPASAGNSDERIGRYAAAPTAQTATPPASVPSWSETSVVEPSSAGGFTVENPTYGGGHNDTHEPRETTGFGEEGVFTMSAGNFSVLPTDDDLPIFAPGSGRHSAGPLAETEGL
jgi:cell division initiation protein